MLASVKSARKPRLVPPPTGSEGFAMDLGDLREKVGFMKGKLEAMETRLDQNDTQRDRMEAKIDHLPELMRDVVKPVIQTQVDHSARIAALEKADAAEQGSISMRTKVFGAVVALAGIAGTIWEAIANSK